MPYVRDYRLDPPEDTRKRVYSCAICDHDILEGDDYYDIDNLGPCCEDCINDAKRYDAELPYYGPERSREEE